MPIDLLQDRKASKYFDYCKYVFLSWPFIIILSFLHRIQRGSRDTRNTKKERLEGYDDQPGCSTSSYNNNFETSNVSFNIFYSCSCCSLVVTSATTEHEISGSIPGSDENSIWNFSVVARSLEVGSMIPPCLWKHVKLLVLRLLSLSDRFWFPSHLTMRVRLCLRLRTHLCTINVPRSQLISAEISRRDQKRSGGLLYFIVLGFSLWKIHL